LVNKVVKKGLVHTKSVDLVKKQTQLILSSQDGCQEEDDGYGSSQESYHEESFEDLFEDQIHDDVDGTT
jgi:hypothetical protein